MRLTMLRLIPFFLLLAAQARATPTVHVYQSGESGIFANAYLVETERGVVVIDATLTNTDSRALHAKVSALGKPLLAVLLTHGHPDHYNGVTQVIAGAHVPVVATRAVADVIRRDDAAKERQWRPVFGDEWPLTRTFPNRQLADGRSLVYDGVRYTVHDLGPGESHADSIWIASAPQWRVAFIGDVVLEGVHSYLTDGHSSLWLANLQRVRDLTAGAGRLYPGHGESGDARLLDEQRDYLRTYREQVAALASGGASLDEIQEAELERRMLIFRPTTRLRFLIKLGANPVARELAGDLK